MSPRARQSKGKARITAYNELVTEAESAERRADRVELSIPPGPRLGDQVVEAAGVVKAFDDRLLMDGLSFTPPPGGIVGVIGPNGAGKTTLFRMIVGEEKPDAGSLTVGASVQLAYVDQSRESLSPEVHRLRGDHRRGGPTGGRRARAARPRLRGRVRLQGQRSAEEGGPAVGGRAQPGAVGQGAQQRGQRPPARRAHQRSRRGHAAGARGRAAGFPGCAVVISHDRWFLDRIATHVLAFEGESEVRWWEGNFSDYEADRHKRLGVDADQPHRLRYKPLVRDWPAALERRSHSRADVLVRRRARRAVGDPHPGRAAPAADTHDAGRPRPERLEVHTVGRVGPLLALGIPVVGQDAAKGVRHLVAIGRDAERRPGPGRPWARARRARGSRARGSPGEGRRRAVARPGEVDEEERRAVTDEEPRAVVVRRPVPDRSASTASGAVAWRRARGAARPASAWTDPWRLRAAGS